MTGESHYLIFLQENKKGEKCTNYRDTKFEVAGKTIMKKLKVNEVGQEDKENS